MSSLRSKVKERDFEAEEIKNVEKIKYQTLLSYGYFPARNWSKLRITPPKSENVNKTGKVEIILEQR